MSSTNDIIIKENIIKMRLSPKQLKFIDYYLETGNGTQSYKLAGYKVTSDLVARVNATKLLSKTNIQEEIKRRNEERTKLATISAAEVMDFFAKVMRGEVLDQFGIETSVADRIKAGQELAKRTIDIENRLAGKEVQKVEIKLDWGDEDTEESQRDPNV